jgi:hypothetical protein
MKVIMLCKTKVFPGKMAEYMELEKKISVLRRVLRQCHPLSG